MTMQSDSSSQSWTPKPYQTRAIKLLLSQASGGLLLDPGLGKTSTVLAAIKILKSKGLVRKILIVAPLRVMMTVWPAEIQKWREFQGLSYLVLHGPKKAEALSKLDVDIYIINPEGLAWLAAQPNLPDFDVLVVDESTKFKASNTQRFKLLRGLLPRFKRRWILTGTPIPNGLEDLFGQVYIMDRGRSLGQYITHFRNQFFDRAPWNVYQWTAKPGAFEQVTELISPLVIRLSAEDNLQMPKLVNVTREVFLPDAAMKMYREVEQDFISGDIVAANAAAAGVKCRQVANGAIYTNDKQWRAIHDVKLDELESLLGEIHPAPVLVFYEFGHDLERLQGRFPYARTLGVGAQLEQTVRGFNAGTVPLLLGHPASMGHGLNLQGSCHHVVWFGIPWNLEHYDQAIARVYRQGQASDRVFVYHIVARNTLDEEVMQVLAEKDRTQQGLLMALVKHREQNYG